MPSPALIESGYLLLLAGIGAAAVRVLSGTGLAGIAAFLVPAYAAYVAAVTAGLVGMLTFPTVAGLLLTAGIAAAVWAARQARPVGGGDAGPTRAGRIAGGTLLVLVLALQVALSSTLAPDAVRRHALPSFLADLLAGVAGQGPIDLSGDVSAYHLPALIEYWQKGTLWSFDGPYQSYSFGHELIAGWSVLAGGSVLTLLLAQALALALLAAAGVAIAASLEAGTGAARLGAARRIADGLLLATFVMAVAGGYFAVPGKNDLFSTACLMAALAAVVGLLQRPAVAGPALLVGAIGVALACGTKPSNLPFLGLWAATVLFVLGQRRMLRSSARVLFGAAAIVLSGLAFSVRNLVAFGSLTGPLAFDFWPTTIAAALAGGGVALRAADVTVLAVMGASLVGLSWAAVRLPGRRPALLCLVLWAACSLATAVVSPFSLDGQAIQWRFAGPAVAVVALGPVLALGGLAGRLLPVIARRWPGTGATGDRRFRALPAAAVLALPLLVPLHRHAAPPLRDLVADGHGALYRWVWGRPGPLRIYSAGLRPLALFGPRLDNRLFYDLNALQLGRDGAARLQAVQRQFHPDLMLFAAGAAGAGTLAWLAGHGCVETIFADATATAFRLAAGCDLGGAAGAGGSPPVRMEP
jgi:hypothetical protein